MSTFDLSSLSNERCPLRRLPCSVRSAAPWPVSVSFRQSTSMMTLLIPVYSINQGLLGAEHVQANASQSRRSLYACFPIIL